MAAEQEGSIVRLIRFLALGVPTLSRIVAVALTLAAIAVAFFDVGDYDDNGRANLALLFALLALISIAVGFALPRLVQRLLPRR